MSLYETFEASRWTHGNFVFPTRIVITDHAVMRRKRSWLRVSEESINIRSVASVNITTGLVWSDIRIESSGGTDPLLSHGHSKSDARRIKELIETLQSNLGIAGPVPGVIAVTAPEGGGGAGAAGAGAGGAETKSCPHCAETIKRAARLCRYCGRDVA